MPVPVFEVLEILLCKILIFAHFQVPIEATSTSATEEFSMAKWPLASLVMIVPSKKNIALRFWDTGHFLKSKNWSMQIWYLMIWDLEIVPMNAGHMVYL